MYFDSHVHVGCPKAKPTVAQKEWLGYSGYVKTTPEKFIKTALAHSVIRALVFPFPFAECGVEKLNAEIIKVAQKYPYFFTPLLHSLTIAFFVTGYTGAGVVYLPGTLLFALAAFIVRRYENKKQNDTQR